jgi:transcription elongation factor Elf1
MDKESIKKKALAAKYPEKIHCPKCDAYNEYLITEVAPGKRIKCKSCGVEVHVNHLSR